MSDITKIKICELMEFVEIIQEIKTKNVFLPKISMLVQIVGKIIITTDSNVLITPFIYTWFLMLGTKPI